MILGVLLLAVERRRSEHAIRTLEHRTLAAIQSRHRLAENRLKGDFRVQQQTSVLVLGVGSWRRETGKPRIGGRLAERMRLAVRPENMREHELRANSSKNNDE